MVRIGLISDTHGYLDPRVLEFLKDTDQVWHAGDIGSIAVADNLQAFKPLRAVYGNIDDHIVRLQFKEIEHFTIEATSVLMTHIGGYPGHYEKNIRELIENVKPQLFVCGHSHILRIIYDKKHDVLSLNPGAAGKSGFHTLQTSLRFTIEGKNIKGMEILELNR
jgi:uncharacterized protein